MRYESLQWDVSTITCDTLLQCVERLRSQPWGYHQNAVANAELTNIANELRSRLQRTDQDPQCEKRDLEPDESGGIEL